MQTIVKAAITGHKPPSQPKAGSRKRALKFLVDKSPEQDKKDHESTQININGVGLKKFSNSLLFRCSTPSFCHLRFSGFWPALNSLIISRRSCWGLMNIMSLREERSAISLPGQGQQVLVWKWRGRMWENWQAFAGAQIIMHSDI